MYADLTPKFVITIKLGLLYNRLRKTGARLWVPGLRHQNQNPNDACSSPEELCVCIQAVNLRAQRPVRLSVVDEIRHVLRGFTPRVWGLPGRRPVATMYQTYQWAYVYGAFSLGLARREFLMAETVDRKHLASFYLQIGESDPSAAHILIQDGAGYHCLKAILIAQTMYGPLLSRPKAHN